MAKDIKEPAPIDLIIKVIVGAIVAVFAIVFIGFAFAFDDARVLLLSILAESMIEVIAVIMAPVLIFILFIGYELLFGSYFRKKQMEKDIEEMIRSMKEKKLNQSGSDVKRRPKKSVRKAMEKSQRQKK